MRLALVLVLALVLLPVQDEVRADVGGSATPARVATTRVVALPDPGEPAWEPVTFPRIARHTLYTTHEDASGPFLRSRSDCAASGRALPVADVDLATTPRLSWRWRVRVPTAIADERGKGGDDFAARVYVLFAYDPERASWLERAARLAARHLYGRELPGEAINYVWTHGTPAGERWTNPFSDRAQMVALRQGPAADPEAWQTEVVDLRADGRALLGSPLPAITAIALMTDSDNACGRASADFAGFRWLGPEPAADGATRDDAPGIAAP